MQGSHPVRKERQRWGLSIEQAAQWFHVAPRRYREIEGGTAWPDADTYDRISRLFGWDYHDRVVD
jgi:hypothetical protein